MRLLLPVLLFTLTTPVHAAEDKREPLNEEALKGLAWRSIGPALMSGRVQDIAIDPADPNLWYVAVGSGGVWKTTNAGTTWTSLFDGQGSYSIGTVTIDPNNRHTIWVGTGENIGGRHAGYGDGVYVSHDAGASWQHKGLKSSERIGRIIVHPEDPNTLWVAAHGGLWSGGGERGLYKSTDGGDSWKQVLAAGPHTGVSDVVIDPRDPDRLYASTWQRQRSVAAYVGGGPESAIHRSLDGGETWEKLAKGLPEGPMGKIALAISPQQPDVLYAAIELERRTGGVWRSADRGASWAKMSDTISGGTGPHYYVELFPSPHAFDRIYLADVILQVSNDGGRSFAPINTRHKHVDDHALAFRSDDPDYLLVGSDGGLYESLDLAQSWRYIKNLSVTQFYKVAVDDDTPFYNVYGGTQDNLTQGGPSRTDSENGIRNDDWFVTLGGDGHQPATEPGNPDIVYSQWQQGNLARFDRTTGEIVYIKPQPEPGDAPERFNWDAPILVSPHDPKRIYHASQRVWRSDDRGDSWRAISGDLSRGQDRLRMPMMGRQQSWDSSWDLFAMSDFATITSLAESPKQDGLLYAGTDDGLIQVSEDGGANWRRIEVGKLPGVPARAFVNDIKADLFDVDTVYVALDNHKEGDFRPFLLVSNDRGRSWRSMVGDLPARHLVWRIVQDHVEPRLFFAATEFGVFVSIDAGKRWVKLAGEAPTIAVRDLAIQRREDDLVAATFGRGFLVLDDYSPLRAMARETLTAEAALYAPRKALWYIPRRTLGGAGKAYQGDDYFVAPNPPFGAVFTYHLREGLESRGERRKKAEKPLVAAGKDTPVPGFDALEAERREWAPEVMVVVRDGAGQLIRRVPGPVKAGVHRVAWDLRYPALDAIGTPPSYFAPEPLGPLAAPGRYEATLEARVDGQWRRLAGPVAVYVERMRTGALPGAPVEEIVAFGQRIAAMNRGLSAAALLLPAVDQRLADLAKALARSQGGAQLDSRYEAVRQQWADLSTAIRGNPSKGIVNEPAPPTLYDRYFHAYFGVVYSTYGPTPAHRHSLEIAESEWKQLGAQLRTFQLQTLPALEAEVIAAGAPWAPGQALPPPVE